MEALAYIRHSRALLHLDLAAVYDNIVPSDVSCVDCVAWSSCGPRDTQLQSVMHRACKQRSATEATLRRFHTPTNARQTPRRRPINFTSPSPGGLRRFTQRPSLLLISRTSVRPQLPFLHPSTFAHAPKSGVGRLLSTETKVRWKQQIKTALKVATYFWSGVALLTVLATGLRQTKVENEYPTPRDWSFWSRWQLRTAHWYAEDENAKVAKFMTDWNNVGWYYRKLLGRLEDENVDGSNIIKGDILVEGVGRTGFDVSMKSEPWRRGYYQALMGAARAAEHLEGMAQRKGDDGGGRLYPWDSIPGPSNPRPKQLPWDRKGKRQAVPSEDEVEDAFPAPEVFYMKILTTTGFDNGQKLDAALAFADWCDFKGMVGTARNMYDWALDIAISGVSPAAGEVVNHRTGVIVSGKDDFVTQNVLRATTAYGVHRAKVGDVKAALPVFLSVLRARKSLPAEPLAHKEVATTAPTAQSEIWAYVDALKNFLFDTPYPAIPSNGDSRPFHSLKEACEEVGLMTYIGEILFATSASEREKGLSWTRDSVEAAEAVLWVMDGQEKQEGRSRCTECLETGLKNWKDMTARMTRLAARRRKDAEHGHGFLGTGLWRGSAISKADDDVRRWQEEEQQIELRTQKTAPLMRGGRQSSGGWAPAGI